MIILLTPVLMLLGCQSSLIYYPRAYHAGYWKTLETQRGQRIEYQTSQGAQVAFYVPPMNGDATPQKLWLCFGGNGALALDWLMGLDQWDPRFGYLLVDYPGYGDCQGKPTPGRIRASSLAAVRAVQAKLALSHEQLQPRLAVLGHSIGCAAALMAADDLDVKSVVLISPFTTLTEMGRRVLGWPLCYLNLHTFDNRKQLRLVCAKGAKVTLFHGRADEIIPVTMSRELAAAHPDAVVLHEMQGQNHNSIVDRSSREIGAAMAQVFQ
ncbi:MAG: alpha/beta fold hydrolase [Prosthecobacter sp.]|nr:alpha/beta fold hydrolase [Prosthecobacter sp.]